LQNRIFANRQMRKLISYHSYAKYRRRKDKRIHYKFYAAGFGGGMEINMYEILKGFIKPEMIVLTPVLYLLGMSLKRSKISDKYIPYILGICGIILSLLYLIANTEIKCWQNCVMLAFTGITQGILLAGASVYVNQLIKQAGKEE